MNSRAIAWGITGVLALQACNSRGEDLPVPVGPPPGETGFERVVPTDLRAVRQALSSPPAISGGTLLVSADDAQAYVADPDRDRVSVVDLVAQRLLYTVALQPGDEPGRLAQDKTGRVHVALRRGGAVVAIDPASGSVVARHPVCGAPRGIAYDEKNDLLHVACAGGDLVSLAPADGAITRRLALGADLRDVVVQGDELVVTRFKSAELLRLDAAGQTKSTRRPVMLTSAFVESTGSRLFDTLDARAAWRTVVDPKGGLVMLHQLARNGEIELPEHGAVEDEEGEKDEGADRAKGGNAVASASGMGPGLGGGASPYGGGGFDCSGVVQSEVTRIDPTTGVEQSFRTPSVVAVDVAVSPIDGTIAIARAGMVDPDQPVPTFVPTSNGPVSGGATAGRGPGRPGTNQPVLLVGPGDMNGGHDPGERNPCIIPFNGVDVEGQVVAVRYTSKGNLLVQGREPAMLTVLTVTGLQKAIPLGGDSVYDTGHELFHRDAGSGMACASCHMEGGDDGHVWVFSTFGQRRTQALHVGLDGTAPFHWQGDMDNVRTLMEEVLVERMGGVHQSPERAAALQTWLFELQPPAPVRDANDEAAVRGRALFEGAAECNSCHLGAKLTDNRTVDVGTGEPLQVPALIGVAYRAPFIHNGCAATLRDRFDPACGGSAHGKTAELSAGQIDDLVAYLETL